MGFSPVKAALAAGVAGSLLLAGCAASTEQSEESTAAADAPAATAAAESGEAAASAEAAAPEADTPESAPQYATTQEVVDAFDTSTLCGEEELTVAFPQAVSNNWMKTAYYLIQQEAKKCPNIKTVLTSDAQVDQQKSISDVNSLAAQGVDGFVTYPLFAQAMVPSFRSAMDAGTKVVTFIASSGGEIGTDVAGEVNLVEPTFAKGWAEWLNTHLKKGKIMFVGGQAGSPSSTARYEATKAALAEYPDLVLVGDTYVEGGYTVDSRLAGVSGALAKEGCVDAVLTDDGAIDVGVIQAFKQAGCPLPYLGNSLSTNQLNCEWQKENFPLFQYDGQQTSSVVAFRRMLASITGAPYDESMWVNPLPFVDTLDPSKAAPICDESAPPLTDWSVPLTKEQILEIAADAAQ